MLCARLLPFHPTTRLHLIFILVLLHRASFSRTGCVNLGLESFNDHKGPVQIKKQTTWLVSFSLGSVFHEAKCNVFILYTKLRNWLPFFFSKARLINNDWQLLSKWKMMLMGFAGLLRWSGSPQPNCLPEWNLSSCRKKGGRDGGGGFWRLSELALFFFAQFGNGLFKEKGSQSIEGILVTQTKYSGFPWTLVSDLMSCWLNTGTL